MHVAVVGAGALGALYGVRLALRARVTVSFVVREKRVSSTDPLIIERVKDDLRETLQAPARTCAVRGDADVILLCVGTEDLGALRTLLSASEAPIVILTPMMPKDWRRMKDAFGERVHAGMPAVVSYVNASGVVRYWVPPAPTRIDEPRAGEAGEAVRALARALDEAGLPAHFELGVHETNPATTVCAIAIGMSLALAGSFEALANDGALAGLASRACSEGSRLAYAIGRPLAGAPFVGPLVASPVGLRLFHAVLRRASPEALFYAEEHFGRKLRAQHAVMAREIAELAEEKGLPHEAFDELAGRLASLAGGATLGA